MKKTWLPLVVLLSCVLSLSVGCAGLNVVVEAETYVREDGGTVEILEGRTAASGNKSVRNWDYPGHALEWDVVIPQTALYKVVIRYNCDESEGIDLIREMTIDGQYPAEEFKSINTFIWTGGWSKGVNNWYNMTVVDADGAPVLIKLQKGVHAVRLCNINGRVGLDSFAFLPADADPNILGEQGESVDLQVIVESDTFDLEEGGTVEILEGRTEASGNKSVRNWDFPGHTLGWTVNIPETAHYKVVIRYNSKESEGIDLIREMQIDGAYPDDAFKNITFYISGGWSSGANNWVNRTVTDAKGKPVMIVLEKGEHKVTLNNVNGRIGLDNFGFLAKEVDPNVLGVQELDFAELQKAAEKAAAAAKFTAEFDRAKYNTLLAPGSAWKYDCSGADLGTAWKEAAFDDSKWQSGQALIGYGEKYLATDLKPATKFMAIFYRTEFDVADPAQLKQLALGVNFDDGFVLYLNGQEIARVSMSGAPGTAVAFDAAASSHEGGKYEVFNIAEHLGKLVKGKNVLAVQVHQTDTGSSDSVWDAELYAN